MATALPATPAPAPAGIDPARTPLKAMPDAWKPLTRAQAEGPHGRDSLMGHKRTGA